MLVVHEVATPRGGGRRLWLFVVTAASMVALWLFERPKASMGSSEQTVRRVGPLSRPTGNATPAGSSKRLDLLEDRTTNSSLQTPTLVDSQHQREKVDWARRVHELEAMLARQIAASTKELSEWKAAAAASERMPPHYKNLTLKPRSEGVEKRKPKAADGCRYVFLDAGMNIGIHSRFLFEPQRYPKARYPSEVFSGLFGDDRSRPSSQSGICSFGWEPNPLHATRLKDLENAYRARGWRTHFFSAGVGNRNGTATWYRTNSPEEKKNKEWGLTQHLQRPLQRSTEVEAPIVDFAAFIINEVRGRIIPKVDRGPPPAVILKMDVEGAEYETLVHMILQGALCDVNMLTFEWHGPDKGCTPLYCSPFPDARAALGKIFEYASDDPACKQFHSRMIDDESYKLDGEPLPQPLSRLLAGGDER